MLEVLEAVDTARSRFVSASSGETLHVRVVSPSTVCIQYIHCCQVAILANIH